MTLRAHDIAYKRPPRVNAADMVREAGGDYRTAVEAVRKLFREGEDVAITDLLTNANMLRYSRSQQKGTI